MRELIIDDGNAHLFIDHSTDDGNVKCGGWVRRDYANVPHGSMAAAPAFPPELIVPRNEWSARIKEMDATKTRLSDVWRAEGIHCLDQNGTNYCWCNAVVSAILAMRAVMKQPYVRLSPASVAAQVKGFRNEGGWGGEALDFIVKHGVAAVDFWPANAIDRRYLTAEMQANALLNRVTEWYDLQPRNFDEKMSCLLNRLPVPSGYGWWSHETCGLDPVEISPNNFGSREVNSWAETFGDKGFFVLSEPKSTPDNAVAPRVVMASVA